MLSDLQTKKLTRYFEVYDVDENGRLAAADFERVLENVRVLHGASNHSPGYQQLRDAYMGRWEALRGSADVDRDGGVDLDEWLAYWQIALEDDARYEAEAEAITDRLFTVFDTDEDGEIGPDEFCDFYGVFGLGANLARSIFIELDQNQDGVISRDELLEIGREFYRGNDPEAPANLLFGPIGV
jgi:Ca2+-binding EF-hand superfamily protein